MLYDHRIQEQDFAVNGTCSSDETDEASRYGDPEYAASTPFLWSNILHTNQEPHASFEDYYAPDESQNDTLTSVLRYNFSGTPGGHPSPVDLTGYGVTPASPQPFMAEDIVIVQDGLCGSTCAIFAELMREQGRVQTIAVGGSKGSQVLGFAVLRSVANTTVTTNAALDNARTFDDSTAIGRILGAEQVIKRVARGDATAPFAGSVNSLNNLRKGDKTNTPLEFVYEAADCKLFYTRETWSDLRALWKHVADVRWRGGKCVEGSTGDPTAVGVIEEKGKNTTSPGKSNTAPIQNNAGDSLQTSLSSLVFVTGAMAVTLVL